MLQLIEERLTRHVCDDVMEVAWSTMWNVTDETALNCKRFLEHSGMQFFLNCLKVPVKMSSGSIGFNWSSFLLPITSFLTELYWLCMIQMENLNLYGLYAFYWPFGWRQAFPNHPELLRNMMGLLGNVAEVEALRPQLMTSEFVSVFSELLYSNSDGIEVTWLWWNRIKKFNWLQWVLLKCIG